MVLLVLIDCILSHVTTTTTLPMTVVCAGASNISMTNKYSAKVGLTGVQVEGNATPVTTFDSI